MKSILLFLCFVCYNLLNAQTYNMSNSTVYTCSGKFYDSGGSDLNYSNSESFDMTFYSDNGNSLEFEFKYFETINYDKLFVYDGPNDSYPMIDVFVYDNAPYIIKSTGNSLFFHFSSDYSTNKIGWEAIISCKSINSLNKYDMSNTTINTCGGLFFDSGGFDNNYDNNVTKSMTINSDNGKQLKVEFVAFETEYGYDYLKIYDGASTSSTLIGSYSGSNKPNFIFSTGTSLTFKFTSDNVNNYAGWSAIISCTQTYNLINENEIVTCEGDFFDSGGPYNNYSDYQDKIVTFSSNNNYQLRFNFTSINIESFDDDFLKVYDGPNTTSSLLRKYSGYGYRDIVTSSGSSLTFEFHSNGTENYSGWHASISCVDLSGISYFETKNDYKIFPNPTSSSFTLSIIFSNHTNYSLKIHNVIGDLIYNENLENVSGEFSKEINLETVPSGIYYLHLTNENESIVRKIIIEK